jgi:hypothetical protein
MADARWEQEGTIQYYDYEPSDVRSMRPEMDAVEVGAAFIHRPGDDTAPTIGIVVALTAQDRASGTTVERAIAAARDLLPRLVERHGSEVGRITENRNYVYAWDGTLVRRVG